MKITDILDRKILREHLDNRLVGVQKHPTLPLCIYNYTPRAAFANVWGDGTIDYCRGLIVDGEDNVIARPFKKFHNLNTAHIAETMEVNLPNVIPTVTEKMDGSLGIYWAYDGQYGIATRGSFTSPQSKWATDYLHEKWKGRGHICFTSKTMLFEIIYKENRIVVDYDFEGLVMLGIVNIPDGTELPYDTVKQIADHCEFKCTDRYDSGVLKLVGVDEENREGYVLSYDVPGKSPVKVKVKFEDYVRLHRVVTGVSPKAIWELLATGADRSFIEATPEHFRNWARSWVDKLYDEFNELYAIACHIYLGRPYQFLPMSDSDYRAKCAEYFKKECKEEIASGTLGVCFAMLDHKNAVQIEQMIWKLIKPRGDDQSFRTDGE